MVPIASNARTALAIAAAGAAIAGGLLLRQRGPTCPLSARSIETSDILTAKLTSAQVLAGDQDIAVTIRMPGTKQARPAVSVAVVLDRSGSMHGIPMENAKAAASALVDALDARDAFSIVTFSDRDELVSSMGYATAAHKAEALSAIDQITDEGGTCTSCGITRGITALQGTPIAGGIRRMVLISDGQANEGLWDRDELVDFAASQTANNLSISTVGVGLDFDEQTMIRISESGHGNYYFVKDTAQLASMFDTELSGLSQTVATDVQLMIEPWGTPIDYAYGYPMQRLGDGRIVIPVADLRAGETRKVVLHAHISEAIGPRFSLFWTQPQGNLHGETATRLVTRLTTNPADVRATRDAETTAAVEEARTSHALEQAPTTFERYGLETTQRALEKQITDARAAGVSPERLQRMQLATTTAIHSFATASADEAKKVTRTSAYELSR
jgi:Ca-activated chloride channel family protein